MNSNEDIKDDSIIDLNQYNMSFNRLNYQKYEYQILDYHQKETGQKTYHWKNIPEYILYESGYIHSYNNLRLSRKNFYIENGIYYNPIREYGLDLISIEENDGKIIYHGIQCKLWNNTITANDLGTFINSIIFRLNKKNNLSKGYLYHTSKLQYDLDADFQNSEGIIIAKKVIYNDIPIIQSSKITLRKYQNDAIKILNSNWNGIKLLTIPCGMGKTEIFSHHLNMANYDNIFILSEYKIHVNQMFKRVKEYLPNYHTLIIDSDDNGTTNFEKINNI
jgi:hypothetical protein